MSTRGQLQFTEGEKRIYKIKKKEKEKQRAINTENNINLRDERLDESTHTKLRELRQNPV